jgi:hypothetical protein
MKTFTSLLVGCSLALAGAAFAQQPEEQQSPTKNKRGAEKAQTAEEQGSGANTANPQATAKERGAKRSERAAARAQKTEASPKSEGSPSENNATGPAGATAVPGGKQAGQHGKGKGRNARTAASATPATAASASATPATAGAASATPAAAGSATPATAGAATATPATTGSATAGSTGAAAAGQQNAGAKARKPDQQQVQQIKSQHANFRAQPKPQQVPAVSFNQNYRIEGSDRWQGPQYEVFRSYHPERHDQGWYRSHYGRVEQIGGGYYYFNNGYWYPAWGYNPSSEYYAYDGPIYVGHRAEPPDRVIADVQAELQQMGYYKGEVDGLLGPLTREALTAYQADQGLTATAVIDEPTLESLGMS